MTNSSTHNQVPLLSMDACKKTKVSWTDFPPKMHMNSGSLREKSPP
jgi:hypothetical protein